MTDADFLAWLKSSAAIRVVILEAEAQVSGVETTFNMSTGVGYTSGAAETPANTLYEPIASVGVLYTEQISLGGGASLAAGEVEIDNTNGTRDTWPTYVWSNRPITAWIGDPRWPRSDFRPIFVGVIANCVSKGLNKLTLKLRDKLQRLNAPITELKLGGTTANKDQLLPATFGECHNVTPLLINPSTMQFQVHGTSMERVIEVRDNAIPVEAVVDLASGTFTLANQSSGTVTASIQGDQPGGDYASRVAEIVTDLALNYGKSLDRFTNLDVDLVNLAAFDAAHPQPVGLWVAERLNILNACQMVAGSVGGEVLMSREGKLRILKLSLPAQGVPTEVRPRQMVDRTLVPTGQSDVVGAVTLGFAKNWTVQEGLQSAIPQEHKDLYAKEWLTSTKTDPAAIAKFKLSAEPVQQDTMLLRRADADAEAQRRLDIWKVGRTTYEFEGVPEMLMLELGQAIKVFHPRFGMAAGVTGQVISLAPDWLNAHVKVGFIV